jgi:hypothetical protein
VWKSGEGKSAVAPFMKGKSTIGQILEIFIPSHLRCSEIVLNDKDLYGFRVGGNDKGPVDAFSM